MFSHPVWAQLAQPAGHWVLKQEGQRALKAVQKQAPGQEPNWAPAQKPTMGLARERPAQGTPAQREGVSVPASLPGALERAAV